MSWLPDPKVTIDGADVTGVTIDQVSVQRGRDRVYASASAGYATVRLLADSTFEVPKVGGELSVTVDSGLTVDASGGDQVFDATTRDGTFQVHRFITEGTATFTLNEPAVVDVLVAGGGGAGGFSGGGGAGGLAIRTFALAPDTYQVVVGNGASALSAAEASLFGALSVPGGGDGDGGSGGSGAGGGSRNGLVDSLPGFGLIPFGNSGGAAFGQTTGVITINDFNHGGGGGGFGTEGGAASDSAGGIGGRGAILDFDGTVLDYASGGGGGTQFDAVQSGQGAAAGGASGGRGGFAAGPFPGGVLVAATAGQPNTGGGGGGGSIPAVGGSGIVIVRIPRRLNVFSGTISDVQVAPVRTADGLLFAYDVTAVGPLARLSRQQVFFDGRTVEFDGVRIRAALDEGFGVPWEEYPDQQWDEVPAETTWLSLDPVISLAPIDRGFSDLAALDPSDDGYGALTVTNESAFSGRGSVFETASGVIGYADRRSRIREADADPVVLSFDDVQVNSFTSALSAGDVTNVADVEWAGGVVQARNAVGIRDVFRLERSFATVLNNEDEAQAFADELVATQGVARFRIQEVLVNLRALDDVAARSELLRLPIGRLLRVTDVPAVIGPSSFEGFIEGVQFGVGEFASTLTLLVSDVRFSVPEFQPVVATGGDVIEWIRLDNGVRSRAHVFTSSDTFDVTVGGTVEYVLIGGGGGGGGLDKGAGGGGAGGLLFGSVDLAPGSYPVSVGAGGAGGRFGVSENGNNGGNSVAFGLTAFGGGGGARPGAAGSSGGSGGGGGVNTNAGGAGTASQGFQGGAAGIKVALSEFVGGGGGGAGGLAGFGTPDVPGAGVELPVFPFRVFAATGGAGSDSATVTPRDGLDELGEGGQGASSSADGGDGGSGIVLVVYPLEPR